MFHSRSLILRSCGLLALLVSAVSVVSRSSAAVSSGGIPGYAVVPLTLMRGGNHATVQVAVDGQPIRLILDTGASTTLLDSAFYKGTRSSGGNVAQEELPAGLPRQTSGNGLKADVGYVSLKAGGVDFGKGPVSIMDLSKLYGDYNSFHRVSPVGGLLGEDVLRRYGAIIDWRRRGVYFNMDSSKRMKNLGRELVAAGWTAVPMASTSGKRFTVPCTVSGKPVKLLVDTGAGFTSFLPDVVPLQIMHNRDSQGSMAHLSSYATPSLMIGGEYTMFPAELDHWKIGNYELEHSYVATHRFPPHSMDDESPGEGPMLGLLGAEIMAANNAIIDIADSTLYLKANAKPKPSLPHKR